MINNTNSNSIGKLVYDFLLEKETNNANEYYSLILNATEKLFSKIIEYRQLTRATSEIQIENSINELIVEIISKPADLERSPDVVNGALKTSSQIRYLAETSKSPEATISSYLTKRAFTLLKYFAEPVSKEYLNNCQNIKKSIKSCILNKKIHKFESGAISHSDQSTICFIIGTHELNFPVYDKNQKPSVATMICDILEQNQQYYFRIKDFVYYLAKNMQNISIIISSDEDISEAIDTCASNFNEPNNAITRHIAIDTLNDLNRFQSSSIINNQIEMAMLVYLCKTVPNYFSSDILSEKQKKLPIIDAIENFLNDNKKFHSNTKTTIQRTTAFTRLDKGKNTLQNVMGDLSALEQMEFIKEYCKYLENRYNEMVGEKHE